MFTIKCNPKRFDFLLIFVLCISLSTAMLSLLGGCGSNENIIQASSLTSGRVTLTWDDISQTVLYDIYLSTKPGVSILNAFRITDVTSPFTVTDLQPGTTYYFMVTAIDESGQRKNSKEAAFKANSSAGKIDLGGFNASFQAE